MATKQDSQTDAVVPDEGTLNGTAQTQTAAPKQPSKASQMREMFKLGKSRSEVAKAFGVTYQTVFAATRGMEQEGGGVATVGRQKIMITHPETGEEVPRIDYIREAFEKGKSRGDIAKELGTTYQIVYQATKGAEQAESDDDDEELEDGDAEDEDEDEDEDEEDADEEEVTAEELLPPTR